MMIEKAVTRGGKPFQSLLLPYEQELKDLRAAGLSIRKVQREMELRHGIKVSHNAIYSFLKIRSNKHKSFIDKVPVASRSQLLNAIKAVWTHDSTAIEGNTLTIGDTMIVLQYGLTINGKPLKDHQDVVSHANAIDFVSKLITQKDVDVEDLFALHRLVMGMPTIDIYKPIGEWKREPNGTYGEMNGKPVYMPYADETETPTLMRDWLRLFNKLFSKDMSMDEALEAYIALHCSFVRIHPFFDGNGRVARLVANLPVLKAGFPPIVIAAEERVNYIRILWDYQQEVGVISLKNSELLPKCEALDAFRKLVSKSWNSTISLVEEACGKDLGK